MRFLGALAALLWLAGMVLLVIGLVTVTSPIDQTLFTRSDDAAAVSVIQSSSAGGPIRLLTVGTALVAGPGAITGIAFASCRRAAS